MAETTTPRTDAFLLIQMQNVAIDKARIVECMQRENLRYGGEWSFDWNEAFMEASQKFSELESEYIKNHE